MMAGKQKCEYCRLKKKKVIAPILRRSSGRPQLTFCECAPDGYIRPWIEGGVNERCPRCIKHYLPCGPPVGPAPREAQNRQRGASLGNQDGGEHEEVQMEQGMAELASPSTGGRSDKQVLMERFDILNPSLGNNQY